VQAIDVLVCEMALPLETFRQNTKNLRLVREQLAGMEAKRRGE